MQRESAATLGTGDARPFFDASKLENSSWTSPIYDWAFSHPQRLMGVARRLAPVLRCPPWLSWLKFAPGFAWLRWVVVLRYDEVREVLSHSREFPVAWGHRMIEVTEGQNFVLGMRQDKAYELSYEQLARAFPREDVRTHVAEASATIAEAILAGREMQEFDAVEDLITAVPTRLCESYFGLRIAEKPLFAKWTLAISSYLFGPSTDATYSALARAAAEHLRTLIRTSVADARSEPKPNTALQHLIDMSNEPGSPVTDDVILGQLFGMVLGFIPTNVLAGGNILETLLRRPDFLERARAAAVAGDDDMLWRCLREALRFRHINPGPWRLCPNGYVLGSGGPRPIRIPPGSKVVAIIQSAMFDSRRIERPHVFDPERRDEDYMVFGVGQHWCLGAHIAAAQITQTFKPLLRMRRLVAVDSAPVRATRFNNLFPLHLKVRFSA